MTCPDCNRYNQSVDDLIEVVSSPDLKIHLRYTHDCRCGRRYTTDVFVNPWAGTPSGASA